MLSSSSQQSCLQGWVAHKYALRAYNSLLILSDSLSLLNVGVYIYVIFVFFFFGIRPVA